MSTVLKVEHKNELRRVSVPNTTTLEALKAKLSDMFAVAQFVLGEKETHQAIDTDECLQRAFEAARQKVPSVLRLFLDVDDPSDHIATCQICDAGVRSARPFFKCIQCSMELCFDCESNDYHTREHLLVKLRQPFSSLSASQKLVFTAHLENSVNENPTKEEPIQEDKQPEVPVVEAKVDPSMNVSLLMSEFQEVVVTEPEKPAEPAPVEQPTSVDKEVACWEAEVPAVENKTEEKEPAPAVPEKVEEPLTASQMTEEKPNPFKQNLAILEAMGFTEREKNIELLVKHVNNLDAVVEELLHTKTSWMSRFGL